ncbi:MAG: hypothetical protein ACLTAF_02800 [Blautia coccoides]
MKKLCAWLLISGMILQTPGTTAFAAVQGQDVESLNPVRASIHGCGQQPEDGCRKQSETPGWQAETLRNGACSNLQKCLRPDENAG